MKASKILIAKLSSSNTIQPLHIYTLPDLYLENIELKTESVYYSIEELIPYFFTKISTSNFDQIFKSTSSEYDLIKDENTGMTLISSDYLNDIAIQNQWYTVALLSKENKIGLINGKISSILESLRLPNIQIYSNFAAISLDIKPAKLRSISVPPCNPSTSPLSDRINSEHSSKISQTSSSTPQYKPMLPKIEFQELSFNYPQRPQQQVHQKLPDSLRLLDNSLPSVPSDYTPKRAIPRYISAPKTLVQSTYANPTARVRGRPRKPVTNPYPQASISPSLGHFGHFKVDPPPQEMILLPPTTPSALRPRYHSPSVNKSPIQPQRPPLQQAHRPPFEPKLRPSPPISRQPTGSEHPLEWCRKEVYNLINLSSELNHRLHKLEECMSNLQPHQPSPRSTPHQHQQQPYQPNDPKPYAGYNRPAPRPERR